MANQYVNKVVRATGEIEIDLSADTVTESDVASGKTFHKADGSPSVGTASGSNFSSIPLELNGKEVYFEDQTDTEYGYFTTDIILSYANLSNDYWYLTIPNTQLKHFDGTDISVGESFYVVFQAQDGNQQMYAFLFTLTSNAKDGGKIIYADSGNAIPVEMAVREAPAVALSASNALRMITGGFNSNLGGEEISDEEALTIITGGGQA